MKIALIYDAVYPFVTGGGEKRNWEIARALVRQGHDVSLLGMQAWDGNAVLMREGVRIVGVCPPTPLFTTSGRRSFFQPLLFARGVYRHLRQTSYDVVDCANFPYLSGIAARMALGVQRPLVITWYEVRGLRGWLQYAGLPGLAAFGFEKLTGWLTEHNVAISALTRDDAVRILRMPPQNVKIIPCGVDVKQTLTKYVKPLPQILYVGRLVQHKRVDLLIEAFARLACDFPEARLRIIGTGHLSASLKDQATTLGLADKVVFSGQVDESVLEEAYRESAVFVLPSEQEGFGMVLLEAMSYGVSVMAARHPRSAAQEIVQSEENGLLFENREGLERGLRRLLEDGEWRTRLAARGKKTAVNYEWKMIAEQCESYYTTVICAKRGVS